jgi:uncharacterized integral membrane protein (TIGR00697 family)
MNKDKLPVGYYPLICASFCLITLLSNIISAKMISVPFLQLNIPAGLLTYPLTFLLSDLITETQGAKKAKEMIYIGLGVNLLAFILIKFFLFLTSIVPDNQVPFKDILQLSGFRIFSSLTAYLFAQIIGIQIYTLIKTFTGPRLLWLRSNGSACVSQLADSIVIDLLYFYWGLGMSFTSVVPIIIFSFGYKTFFNISTTPLFYFAIYLLKNRNIKQARENPAIGEALANSSLSLK